MKLKVFGAKLEISMIGPHGLERLRIRSEYANNEVFTSIFQQFSLMHLIAPYLPGTIETDFPIDKRVRLLINSMYESEHKRAPKLVSPTGILKPLGRSNVLPGRIVIAYSGGKDSLWNLWWAQNDFGLPNVLAVHIKGLNRYFSQFEWQSTLRQQKEIGFSLNTIDLLNSSRNRGYNVMLSRDIFVSTVIAPLALKFKASKILIEGGMIDKEELSFTERTSTWLAFNSFFKDINIPLSVNWRDRDDIDVIKDLLENVPTWLPLVYDCVSSPTWKSRLRQRWKQIAPTFFLYDSQCGSCSKCRVMNLARVLYDRSLSSSATDKDIKTFLIDIRDWAYKWKRGLGRLLQDNFWDTLKVALDKYSILDTS